MLVIGDIEEKKIKFWFLGSYCFIVGRQVEKYFKVNEKKESERENLDICIVMKKIEWINVMERVVIQIIIVCGNCFL